MRSSSWYPKLMPSRRDLLIQSGDLLLKFRDALRGDVDTLAGVEKSCLCRAPDK
jgi:hypothetical protein